jgi:hypothetical protein
MTFEYKKFIVAVSFIGIFSCHSVFAAAPTVITGSVSNVTDSSATLSGDVVDNGGHQITSAGFQYGLTNAYGSTVNSSASYVFKSFPQ